MRNKIFLFIVFFLSLLPIFSLFHPGLPITHDGQDHIARILAFAQNLKEGTLIPRWGGVLNWGYGHPILEFLYPLPSYIASASYLSGVPIIESIKLVFALGMILSFLFMYLWLSRFLSKYAALFGAVLYTYAPYRFVDLYVRGDIGENLAFAFVPLTLFFTYKLFKNNDLKYSVFGGVSLAFLILSHNAIALITIPFIFLYGLYLAYVSNSRKPYLLSLIYLTVLGFSISAFFWIPGLLEAKYTLRNIVTAGTYANRFVSLSSLLYGPWSYGGSGQFTVQLGIAQWVFTLASPILIYKLFKKNNKLYTFMSGLFLFTIVAIFIMLPSSNFIWEKFILLQNFQFPWRFLSLTVLTTAVLGAFVTEYIPANFRKYSVLIFILLVLFFSKDYWNAKDYFYKPTGFENGIYRGTTDTGESAPIWSVRFMEQAARAHLEVIDGHAKIKELKRTSTYHKYQLTVASRTLFRENTLYFPGWEIKANGKPQNIEFQNMTYRGVMLFSLDKGKYTVEAVYKETKLRIISDYISLLSIVGIALILSFAFLKKRNS